MGKKRRELSHAEVWDDSALLQSWDDALEEYKLYHSIHARGERVEDVIKAFESTSEAGAKDRIPLTAKHEHKAARHDLPDDLEDGELGEEAATAGAVPNTDSMGVDRITAVPNFQNPHSNPDNAAMEQQQQVGTGMPNAIVNGVQDEALKNLMMSWYWAGFHTGYYEGQQGTQTSESK